MTAINSKHYQHTEFLSISSASSIPYTFTMTRSTVIAIVAQCFQIRFTRRIHCD